MTERDWIQLAEQMHFIKDEPAQKEFNEKLKDITTKLKSNDLLFKKIQPRWEPFWKNYNDILKLLPVNIQDSDFLQSFTQTLSGLTNTKISLLHQILSSIPENQRLELFQALSKWTDTLNPESLRILNGSENRKELLQLLDMVVNKKFSSKDLTQLLKMAQPAAPPPLLKALIDPEMKASDILKITAYVLTIPDEAEFQLFEELLKNAETVNDKLVIFEIISQMSKTDKNSVIDLLNHFPIQDLTPEIKMEILMGSYLFPDLQSLKAMDGNSKFVLLNLIDFLKINYPNEVFEIIKDAKFLIKSDMSPYDISELLEQFADLPSPTRKSLLYEAEMLDPSLVASLIVNHGGESLDIIRDAKPFIKPGMSLPEMKDLFSLMASIPKSKRKQLIHEAEPFMNPYMNWIDKMTVLYILTKTPNALRSESLKEVQPSFTLETPWIVKLHLFLSTARAKQLEKAKILAPFKEPIEDTLEMDFPEISIPIPSDSLFANTDLRVFKDDFKGILPLNGIKESELVEIEKLAQDIFSGKTKFAIASEDKQFQNEIQNHIKALLTRPLGRVLIKKIIDNKSITFLPIIKGDKCAFKYHRNKTTNVPKKPFITFVSQEPFQKGHGPNGQIKKYDRPDYVVLGHELIHAVRFPECGKTRKQIPFLNPNYDNLEEQITITGFKKNIDIDLSEEIEDSDFTKKDFDILNERNLHAQFASSKNAFHPRFGHRKPMKMNLLPQNRIQDFSPSIELIIPSYLWYSYSEGYGQHCLLLFNQIRSH